MDAPDSDDDEALLAFAVRSGMTLYHPTSSGAIGAVVDPELRMVDASSMPTGRAATRTHRRSSSPRRPPTRIRG